MGIFGVFRRKPKAEETEEKSVTTGDLDQMLRGLIGPNSAAGVAVTGSSALECAPFYASIRVLAEAVAQQPFILYKRIGEGKKRATDHPLYSLLHDSPNEFQTSFEFRQCMMINALVHNHAFAFINRDGAGKIQEIIPIAPDSIKWEVRPDFSIKYEMKNADNGFNPVDSKNIFRVSGFPGDISTACTGTPLTSMRESIGLSIAAEQFGARLFANGARPGGVFKHPGKLSDEAKKNFLKLVQEGFSGTNAHKNMLLQEGMEWVASAFNPEESQMLQTRKHQRSEIAGAVGVPPHLIGDLDRATFSNVEHQSIQFDMRALLPWDVRWEQAVSKYLLTEPERKRYFAELLIDSLLRADIETRYKAYTLGIQHSIFNADEVRARENMNPIPDGEGKTFYYPANLVPVGTVPAEQTPVTEEGDKGNATQIHTNGILN